jgi:hypothetical protein
MRNALGQSNWQRLHNAGCLLEDRYAEGQEEPRITKRRIGRPDWLAADGAFLGHPAAVVQRWASEGMPVRRQGRFVTTTQEELNAWPGRESGKSVHVASADTDLAAELKRGLAFVRREKEPSAARKQSGRSKKAKPR